MPNAKDEIFANEIAISTPYGIVYIRDKGREITFKLHDTIAQSEHNQQLFNYATWLHNQGVERINCAHIRLDFNDYTLKLQRGSRVLDIVYIKENRMYECELKTHRQLWLEGTAHQLRDLEQHTQNLILLVPRNDVEQARNLLLSLNLNKTTVDTYEV